MLGFLKKDSWAKMSLKRKPGGTMMGNLLRNVVHKQTQGAFGNGAMLQHTDESNEDFNNRMIKSIGAGLSSASDTAGPGDTHETESKGVHAFTAGVISAKVKHYAIYAIPAIIIAGIIYFFTRKKR